MTNKLGLCLVLLLAIPFAFAQTGTTGSVAVSVVDSSGSVVPGAQLEIRDVATGHLEKAATAGNGTYTFVGLSFGTYELTITAPGFQKEVFTSVRVQTAQVTNVRAGLKVGGVQETVMVAGEAAPLVQTESNVLSNTVDTKQVTELPLQGRSMFNLSLLVPGWASTGPLSTVGTFNNMPGAAIQSADYDGTTANANRFRSSGYVYGTSAVSPRIENIAEMTISTAQLDLSGTGSAAMRINMVTRRGSNAFHGRLFEDFRNSDLNANSWFNNNHNTPVTILKLNDFGGSIGGPIIKDKLFFFGTFATSIQPATKVVTQNVLSPAAAAGNFSYVATGGAIQTINVLQLAGGAGAPSTVNSSIAAQLAAVNGSLSKGSLTPTADPNINSFNFQSPYRVNTYYPAVRFDYNMSEKLHFGLNYSQTKTDSNGINPPNFPGVDTIDFTSNQANNKNAGFNADWTLRPTLINQFHAGYLYQYSLFDLENLGVDLSTIQVVTFAYGAGPYGSAANPGGYYRQPISSLYPVWNLNDSLNWQKGAHTIVIGGGWQNEHDHYWNGPSGFPGYTFAMSSIDPLVSTFTGGIKGATSTQLTNAENLYAELTGRVSGVSIAEGGRPLDPATKQYKPFGQYNLDEVMSTGNVFIQDRWRIRPNLTLNYGLRADMVGDDYDVNGGYSSPASLQDFWGPTPIGAIFKPGTLGGQANPTFTAKQHVYNPIMNFSPAIAVAWSPDAPGFLGKLLPKDKTAVRAGWSLRSFQEGQQNFWAWGSNQGLFFFQQGSLTPDSTATAVGTFKPGSLFLGQPLPAYNLTPATWSPTIQASALSFGNNSFFGMNPNIGEPYVEQWNIGIQREIGHTTVFEVRYEGNMSQHTWMSYNLNEVNILENGFLSEFQHAQANLTINQANGKGSSFAYNGFTGQSPLPIMTAAFGSATSNFTNGTFVQNLQQGAAGTMAQTIARNVTFFCNMVGGANFSPCATRGFAAAGPYPINFWEENPFTTGFSNNYLDSAGHSNYHALQVELRQRLTHGMQFQVNYTLAKSMVQGEVNAYQANVGSLAGSLQGLYWTDRNFRLNYVPSGFDIRHVLHLSGTYDLPFGKGRKFLHDNAALNYVVGGWTLGTITIIQSGNPVQTSGGFDTLNQNDSGLAFGNGLTATGLQNQVGVFRSGNPWVYTVNPSLLASNGAVNQADLSPASTAGQLGYRPIIYGPRWFNSDVSLNKYIPIRERLQASLQFQFLNLFNHPTFNLGSLSPQSLAFAQSTGGATSPRLIEMRFNIEF